MLRYCLKPRTRAAIEREAAKLTPSRSTLALHGRHGSHHATTSNGDMVTPKWARDYLKLPCVKSMTPAQASRDLAAHLKRWKEEREWGKGPGASDLRWKGNLENWT